MMIPVIDMDAFSAEAKEKRGQAQELLLQACEEWGCFRLVNHRIPVELLQEMKRVVRSLLDLPAERKKKNVGVIGYVEDVKDKPFREGLGIYDFDLGTAVDDFGNQLKATLPQREVIKSYIYEVNGLALDIACKIAESMGFISSESFKGWHNQIRFHKCSFSEEKIGSLAIPIHTDSGFLTVLQPDDTVRGLEVMDKAGDFMAVDHVPGSLIVNLGDIAKVWSNGRLHNVMHRVQCKVAVTRVSIALFLLGPREGMVEPLPALVDADHPRIYKAFPYEEYRRLRFSPELLAGGALSHYIAP